MRRRLLAGFVMVLALAACGGEEPEAAVRPLVDLDGVDLSVGDFDDASIQQRLELLEEEIAPLAKAAGGWGRLDTDKVNPEITDLVFISAERATLNYGYGTEATSMLSRDEEAIFVMAGDSGSCWAIRFSGPIDDPQVRYTNKFAPNCYANEMSELEEIDWKTAWPAPAEPTGNFGTPPDEPTGRNGAATSPGRVETGEDDNP